MKLRPRLLVLTAIVAIPLALLVTYVIGRIRSADMSLALNRFITSQMTDDFRDRCESNPNWFLAGPREDRPSPEVLAAPDADVTAPRPPTGSLPFEYFAYDTTLTALSTAGPSLPANMRQVLRTGYDTAILPFVARDGTGWQKAIFTKWKNSPCTVILFRMHARPHQTRDAVVTALALSVAFGLVGLVAGGPIVWRVRRMGLEARQSASEEYRSTLDVGGRDELGALAFAFNEAASDIRRRATDVKDREDSLRRFIAAASDDVAAPLAELTRRLDALGQSAGHSPQRAAVNDAIVEAHTVGMRMQNLSVTALLRMRSESAAKDTVNLADLADRVVARQAAFARAMNVTVTAHVADRSLAIAADRALVEQAVNNLVDNAIRYNRPGGQAAITVDRTPDGRVSLRVADDGPPAPAEVLAKLNANRRFRGDEGRSVPGELGLGLAVVREVGDRFGIQWAFRTSANGWFEAELLHS